MSKYIVYLGLSNFHLNKHLRMTAAEWKRYNNLSNVDEIWTFEQILQIQGSLLQTSSPAFYFH